MAVDHPGAAAAEKLEAGRRHSGCEALGGDIWTLPGSTLSGEVEEIYNDGLKLKLPR